MSSQVAGHSLRAALSRGLATRLLLLNQFSFPFLKSWRQSLDEILGLAAQDLEDRKEKNLQVSRSPIYLYLCF